MSWAEEYRIKWIEETVFVFGYINRFHIMRKFRISAQQASTDLNNYMKLKPNNIVYNKSTRQYEMVK